MTRRWRTGHSVLEKLACRSGIDDLPLWALSEGASTWIADLEPFEEARVAGVVERMRIAPMDACIQVVVWDGTGEMEARWSIRRPTPELAVAPGRFVVLTGVPVSGEGSLVMLEPRFSLTVRHAVWLSHE